MSKRISVILWAVVTAIVGGYYGYPFFGGNKEVHLPGKTTDGHYQIEIACEQCHTSWDGVKQDACTKCHGEDLAAANDSHSESKFADPRNADRVAALDASRCVTCHREHEPDITHAVGVTQPADFCVLCHQDIGTERPSHKSFTFEGCSTGGCHNYHDNRGNYEEFLTKHMKEPEQLALAAVLGRSTAPAKNGQKPLGAKDQDAPAEGSGDAALLHEWESTAHAKAGVNCSTCHQVRDAGTNTPRWERKPGYSSCSGCHTEQVDGFLGSKHGMRMKVGMTPMKPGMARQPMKAEAHERELGCNSCHGAHKFDTRSAAVESCLSCHNDKHSLAYQASRHFKLWEAEKSGAAGAGTGVSCATCHLPRELHKKDGAERTVVMHNQNDNLRPNEKMIRGVCMSCHGLGFSMDSLADSHLVERCFNGRPGKHIESLDMAAARMGDTTKKGE